MRRVLRTTVLLSIILGILGAAPASSAWASDAVDDFRFSSFEADYYLDRAEDGSSRLRTVETLVAEFPDADQNKGIVRAIPTAYEGADVDVQVIEVADGNGEPVQYKESYDDGFLELALGTDEYVRGSQTYVITYEQRHVTRSYNDTESDEFYWDTNGTGWAQPFDALTVRVHLDEELGESLTGNTACYRGGEGSDAPCSIQSTTEAEETLFSATADDLGPGENVTVAISFDPGTFAEPRRARDAARVAIVPAIVAGFALLLLIGSIVLRMTRLRDAPGRGVIVPQYTPPRGINPMLAGSLVGRDSSALAAQLVSFAVRRVIRIIDTADTEVVPPDQERYLIEYTGDRAADELVDAHEHNVLLVLFGADFEVGDVREIGPGQKDIAQSLHAQLNAAPKEAVTRGFRRSAAKGTGTLLWIACGLLAIALLIVFIVLAAIDALSALATILLIGAFAVMILAVMISTRGPLLTDKGAEARDDLIGLRDYLQLAEADRFRMLQSPTGADRSEVDVHDTGQVVHLYEKLLPYAVLWGIEKQWAGELDRLYSGVGGEPEWIVGTRPFDTAVFASLMTSFNGQATATAAAAWTGSGGSSAYGGSMGGGFSGGGGGGGGGGGR